MNYADVQPAEDRSSNLIIESRRRISVTGVEDVLSFDDNTITLQTCRGFLVIRGSELHMEKLSLDCGEISAAGVIDDLEYETEESAKESFFSRLFR